MYHYAAFAELLSHRTIEFRSLRLTNLLDFVVFSRQKKFEEHTKNNPLATFVINKIIFALREALH